MVENVMFSIAGRAMSAVCKWRGGGNASIPMPVTSPVGKDPADSSHTIYELLADWDVSGALPDGRAFRVAIRAGFQFDGASIPRALWTVCGHPMEVPRVAAALPHDWLYAAHVCSRADADAIYAEVCRMAGVDEFRVWVEHGALRLAGGAAWCSHGKDYESFARAHGALALGEQTTKGQNA